VKILNKKIVLDTAGTGDLVDITGQIRDIVRSSKLEKGSVIVFIVGSTAAITTFEYEPGMVRDVKELFERLIPSKRGYHHDETWNDANGFSHLRASLQGPSLTIPFDNGEPLLGTWQQVVVAEFDTRPRQRQVVVQLIGE